MTRIAIESCSCGATVQVNSSSVNTADLILKDFRESHKECRHPHIQQEPQWLCTVNGDYIVSAKSPCPIHGFQQKPKVEKILPDRP